jgi:NAD(P)-dependent dehydrogenase (short-subunit alcohol dehydrogenase family)
LVDRAVAECGRLDVMFNNAGIMHPEDDNGELFCPGSDSMCLQTSLSIALMQCSPQHRGEDLGSDTADVRRLRMRAECLRLAYPANRS